MDPNIILSGQSVDVLGAMSRGNQLASQVQQSQDQNALRGLYRSQGANILAGKPQALNALAGLDPMAAMDVQSTQQGMRAREMELQTAYDNAKMRAAELAASMDATTRQAEAARLEQGLSGAAFFYQKGDRAGYEAFLAQQGLDPAQFPFEAFPAHAATVKGAMDALKAFTPEQPTWRPATPQEAAGYGAAGGQINAQTGEFKPINPPSGMTFQTSPDGTVTMVQGPGVTVGGKPTEGNLSSAGYLQRMTAAEKRMDELSQKGVDTIGLMQGMATDTRAEGYVLSGDQQRLLQAQRDWVRAKLRRESGAVIGADEMAAEIRTYFPQPGEDAETIAQKREARKEAERQLQIGAGPAAPMAGPTTSETQQQSSQTGDLSDEELLKLYGG